MQQVPHAFSTNDSPYTAHFLLLGHWNFWGNIQLQWKCSEILGSTITPTYQSQFIPLGYIRDHLSDIIQFQILLGSVAMQSRNYLNDKVFTHGIQIPGHRQLFHSSCQNGNFPVAAGSQSRLEQLDAFLQLVLQYGSRWWDIKIPDFIINLT